VTLLNKDIVYFVLALLSVIIFIFTLTRKTSGQSLIIDSWIRLACVIVCGIAIGSFCLIEVIVPMLIYIIAYDIFSFTRYGKNTLNAKIINNSKYLPRLLVYGRSFKTGGPVPTKGLGDYFWYSITFSAINSTYGKAPGLFALMAIFLGVVINLILVSKIYKYSWYKGFPATLGPLGICLILVTIIYIVR